MQLLLLGVNEIRFAETLYSAADVTCYATNPGMQQ